MPDNRSKKEPKGQKPKPGPEPDRLKLDEENWQDAMGKAIKKPKPKEGWPDEAQEKDQQDD